MPHLTGFGSYEGNDEQALTFALVEVAFFTSNALRTAPFAWFSHIPLRPPAPAVALADDAQAADVKPAVLVVGFGTSFDESCHITIGAIESAVREAFPECDVRRAFTAQF